MKKLFASLLLASSLCLAGCSQSESSSSVKGNLQAKGYNATVYTAVEAKARISGLNFEGIDLTDAVYATKGSDENADLFLVFFFSSIDFATTFFERNNYENMGMMSDYAKKNLGENLTVKVGIKNNAAYCGSETALSVAF